ncbi:MAG TPA: hypothetical protein VGB84_06220 [Arachidicoccus sp.]
MSLYSVCVLSQQGTTINLKGNKPPEDANKTLRSEKTDYGKLGKTKKFIQNTFVHYNYLFNANHIYNEIMQDAIAANVDDYSQLLSFYPYDEKSLASNHRFDSVIQHATAGLLLHDLRNDYVDELYFILGKSYYFERKLDTAQQAFQYITYVFAPKDDGYDMPVGSNISSTDKSFSIVSKESGGIGKNNLKNINRRNDALLWLARNFCDEQNYIQAGIMLNNLEHDAHFPQRLKGLYYETKAYFFYLQKMYDSAGAYLSKCSFDDDTKRLRSRRFYLAAQLFQISNDDSLAMQQYNLVLQNTNDAVLEIYAQKNIIQLKNKINHAKAAENDLNPLLKKNKYYPYKDLIYYYQAAIARDNQSDSIATNLLWQSVKANRSAVPQNPEQKSKSFLMLGDIAYDDNRFNSSSHYYDSVSANHIKDSTAGQRLQLRLSPLKQIASNYDSIDVQDSLLALANMPEKERMDLLKQKAKQIRRMVDRREQSSEDNTPVNSFARQNQQQQPVDLFGQNNSASAWYFNNSSLKSSGYQLFKQKFGNRPNVDNWQRIAALGQTMRVQNDQLPDSLLMQFNSDGSLKIDSANITAEDLLASLPLTTPKKAKAAGVISSSMLDNGEVLMNRLENFTGAIVLLDSLIAKYPSAEQIPKALYDEFVCYTLLGNKIGAGNIRSKLLNTYAANPWALKLQDAEKNAVAVSPTSIANAATKVYSDIYDLFLAGKFDEAVQRKAVADKEYGKFYWTPQLLYIEAVYYATQRNDSAAIKDLNFIINSFANSVMVAQAKDMIDVLMHRKEIEAYLASLNVKPEDYSDANMLATLENAARRLNRPNEERRVALLHDSLAKLNFEQVQNELPGNLNVPVKEFNIAQNETDTVQGVAVNNSAQNAAEDHLPSVDSSMEAPAKQNIIDTLQNAVVKNNPLLQNNAADNTAPLVKKTDSLNALNNNSLEQNISAKNKAVTSPAIGQNNVSKPESRSVRMVGGFTFDDNAPVYVTIVLDNVAPVFASEAGNAFNRYNLLSFPSRQFDVRSQKIGDDDLVLIGPFKNQQEAKDYQAKIQPAASNEIVPWITPDKYSFIKISPQNLGKLHSKSDVEKYRAAAMQAGNQ